MSERPTKRQKRIHNVFIDDLAADSDRSSEEEGFDEDIESDGFVEPSFESPVVQHSARALRTENNEFWGSFLKRAEQRGGSRQFSYDVEDISRVEAIGQLWEIGCKVGYEEQAAFKALMNANHPDASKSAIKSVIARSSIPGRIFAETEFAGDARKLAASIKELKPNIIRLVAQEDVPAVLHISKPFSLEGKDWARTTGRGSGWAAYKGDIGLLVPYQGTTNFIVIPRISTVGTRSRQRPDQSLYPAHVLKSMFGEQSITRVSPDGSFTYNNRRFTKDGFICCPAREANLFRPADDLPTRKELELFKLCSLLDEKTLSRTSTRLDQMEIATGSRVVIVQGEYRGLIGRVNDVDVNEVAVFIESLDQITQLAKSAVRSTFRIGDEVHICNGDHSGSTGWIVDVQEKKITVINVEKDLEVSVGKDEVKFHDRPFISGLRKRTPAHRSLAIGQDPNRIYHGKRVVVTGESHYKSYKGIIKDTNPDGDAWVELEAKQQQVVKFQLEKLALLINEESSLISLKEKNREMRRPIPVASISGVASSASNIARCSTPIPDSNDTVDDSDAWNPGAPTPRIERTVHWLENEALRGTRIKLFIDLRPNDILEFKEVMGDDVKVRDGRYFKNVLLEDVRAVRPNDVGDLVTPLTGPMIGVVFKVRAIQEDVCIVRRPGKVLKKNEADPSYPTACLIQTFPYTK